MLRNRRPSPWIADQGPAPSMRRLSPDAGLVAPSSRILEHAHPGGRPQPGRPLQPGLRRPRPLPWPDCHALWVRHHGEVAPVRTAQADDALRGAVRVEGVGRRRPAVVVNVPQRHQLLRADAVEDGGGWEMALALPVRDPDAELRALHALEPHRGGSGLLDAHGGEARLEAAAVVVDEARLLVERESVAVLCTRDPTQQRQQLAAVTDPQREGVRALAERAELRLQLGAEEDGARPSLCRVLSIGIAEAAHKGGATEGVERNP